MTPTEQENRIFEHTLFCIAVIALLILGTWVLHANGFRLGESSMLIARYTFFIGCIYSGRWLCQQWFTNKKVTFLVLYFVLVCAAIAVLWWLLIVFVLGSKHAGLFDVIISALPFYAIGIVTGMVWLLIRKTLQLQLREARIASEQKQSELELLQSQLSPHFLFNTLNNLYGISMTQHEKIPNLLLKLSDLLRYTVYDTKKAFVPLKDEWQYINNFNSFEKLRISDRLVLIVNAENTDQAAWIAPMILIVFIENAFKHAKNTLDEKIFIWINLRLENGRIILLVKNSFSEGNTDTEHSGLGLRNTIKRLGLLYGNNYTLHQYVESDLYCIELTLPISNESN